MMGTIHVEASADRIQTYPYPCTPTVQITENWVFDELWKYSRNDLETCAKNVEIGMNLFREGLQKEEGQGDFDFPNGQMTIQPHDHASYNGE
jgi:hypothetical protein